MMSSDFRSLTTHRFEVRWLDESGEAVSADLSIRAATVLDAIKIVRERFSGNGFSWSHINEYDR